jgi:hypothetical protein
MRKKLLIAAAAAATALVASGTAANADPGDQLIGGCGLTAAASDGANSGAIYNVSVSLEGTATNGPSFATVACWIDINGTEVHGTHLNTGGFGVQAGELGISYQVNPGDTVALCQQVTFLDGSTWTASDGNVGTDCTTI